MKRIIVLTMVLVMMFASIGCWPGWYDDGRDGRGGGHDRGRGHDSDRGHDGGGGHEQRR